MFVQKEIRPSSESPKDPGYRRGHLDYCAQLAVPVEKMHTGGCYAWKGNNHSYLLWLFLQYDRLLSYSRLFLLL